MIINRIDVVTHKLNWKKKSVPIVFSSLISRSQKPSLLSQNIRITSFFFYYHFFLLFELCSLWNSNLVEAPIFFFDVKRGLLRFLSHSKFPRFVSLPIITHIFQKEGGYLQVFTVHKNTKLCLRHPYVCMYLARVLITSSPALNGTALSVWCDKVPCTYLPHFEFTLPRGLLNEEIECKNT